MSLFWCQVYIEHSQSVQYFAHSFTTCQAFNTIASYEYWYQKNEHVQQSAMTPVFKCQTSTFYFSTYPPNLLKHWYWNTPIRLHEWLDCCDHCVSRKNNTSARSFFINNIFSSMSKLLTPKMYCWSSKTLVTIYWTHLRVNGILAKSFCLQKMNNRMPFSMVTSLYFSFTNDDTVTSLQ